MKIWGTNTAYNCIKHHRDLIIKTWVVKGYKNPKLLKLFTEKRIKPLYVESQRLTHFAHTHRHQNIVLDINLPAAFNWESFLHRIKTSSKLPLILLLDQITDPQNLGAILRSAYLFNVQGVIIPSHNQASINSTVINVSTGAALSIPVLIIPNLNSAIKKLKANGFWIYSTTLNNKAQNYRTVQFDTPTALILGSEGKGVRELITKNSDVNIFIPMRDKFNSLNVSVAAAILMENIKYQQNKHIEQNMHR